MHLCRGVSITQMSKWTSGTQIKKNTQSKYGPLLHYQKYHNIARDGKISRAKWTAVLGIINMKCPRILSFSNYDDKMATSWHPFIWRTKFYSDSILSRYYSHTNRVESRSNHHIPKIILTLHNVLMKIPKSISIGPCFKLRVMLTGFRVRIQPFSRTRGHVLESEI